MDSFYFPPIGEGVTRSAFASSSSDKLTYNHCILLYLLTEGRGDAEATFFLTQFNPKPVLKLSLNSTVANFSNQSHNRVMNNKFQIYTHSVQNTI